MALKHAPANEDRFLMYTDWRGYEKILSAIGEGHTRVNYDTGRLELVSPSPEHGIAKVVLAGLVEVLLEDRGLEYIRGGSITFRRKVLDKGLEPDDCFWIAHWESVVGIKRWNPQRHPPPDLAVEIEVTESIVSRLPILAALGVPEVWRWRNGEMRPLRLGEHGRTSPWRPARRFRMQTSQSLRSTCAWRMNAAC